MILKNGARHAWTAEQKKKVKDNFPAFFEGKEVIINYIPERIKKGVDGLTIKPAAMIIEATGRAYEDGQECTYQICDSFDKDRNDNIILKPGSIDIQDGLRLSEKKNMDLFMFLALYSPSVRNGLCDAPYKGNGDVVITDPRSEAVKRMDSEKIANKIRYEISDTELGLNDVEVEQFCAAFGFEGDDPVIRRDWLYGQANDPKFQAKYLALREDTDLLEIRTIISKAINLSILNYSKVDNEWQIMAGDEYVSLTGVSIAGRQDPKEFLANYLSRYPSKVNNIKVLIGLDVKNASIEGSGKTIKDFGRGQKTKAKEYLVGRTQAEFDGFFADADPDGYESKWREEFAEELGFE